MRAMAGKALLFAFFLQMAILGMMPAFAGDKVMMATSEDINAFDESLGRSDEWLKGTISGEKNSARSSLGAKLSQETQKARRAMDTAENQARKRALEGEAREDSGKGARWGSVPGKGLEKDLPKVPPRGPRGPRGEDAPPGKPKSE